MKKINEDFNIPYYIFEEIVEYVEQTAQRKKQMYEMEQHQSTFKVSTSK